MTMKLYVGSLAYSTTSDELNALFGQVGTVETATVITDKFSGQSKGFGFVEMSSKEEAQRAIQELNGRSVGGRSIVVNEAKPREERGGPGGGGPRGGGGGRRW